MLRELNKKDNNDNNRENRRGHPVQRRITVSQEEHQDADLEADYDRELDTAFAQAAQWLESEESWASSMKPRLMRMTTRKIKPAINVSTGASANTNTSPSRNTLSRLTRESENSVVVSSAK